MIYITTTNIIPNIIENISGLNTQNQDQCITPTNFRTINIRVNVVKNPPPILMVFLFSIITPRLNNDYINTDTVHSR